jgi:NitT/TauT family transport system permease protein
MLVRAARRAGPPLVFGIAFLGVWEWAVRFFELKPYFLTAPSVIWRQFVDGFGLVRGAATVSGTNALVGLVAGTILGVCSTGSSHRSPLPSMRSPSSFSFRC